MDPKRRKAYRDALEFSARQVGYLLAMAEQDGYRTDCLREAARALDGAVRNVQHEDDAVYTGVIPGC